MVKKVWKKKQSVVSWEREQVMFVLELILVCLALVFVSTLAVSRINAARTTLYKRKQIQHIDTLIPVHEYVQTFEAGNVPLLRDGSYYELTRLDPDALAALLIMVYAHESVAAFTSYLEMCSRYEKADELVTAKETWKQLCENVHQSLCVAAQTHGQAGLLLKSGDTSLLSKSKKRLATLSFANQDVYDKWNGLQSTLEVIEEAQIPDLTTDAWNCYYRLFALLLHLKRLGTLIGLPTHYADLFDRHSPELMNSRVAVIALHKWLNVGLTQQVRQAVRPALTWLVGGPGWQSIEALHRFFVF